MTENVKIKIEQAYPLVRMLERPRSFVYEIWAWKIHYLIVPIDAGCMSCKIKQGTMQLPLTGLGYSKHTLSKEVALEMGIELK